MRAHDAGLGAREVLAVRATGRVVAVYSRAAYLRFPAGLLAVTTLAAPAGPLHLRCPALPPLRVGEAVRTDGSRLWGPSWALNLDAPTWVGALPAPVAVEADGSPELRALAAAVGGRGPGLTPAGDDLLAGVLLGTRARRGPTCEPELCAIAAAVPTSAVAGAFLAWAARGQCIEPAHDVLLALAGDHPDAGPAADRAGARLSAVGASSGRALLAGLRVAGRLRR